MKIFRWRAIGTLGLFSLLFMVGWALLADSLVRRGVETIGGDITGAKVDVSAADLRAGEGSVILRGLEVANPEKPMQNLVEAAEVVAAIAPLPLLERKLVIDSLALRGVRFGTTRRTSGALEHRSPQSGRVAREVTAWAAGIQIPPFSLAGLGRAIDVGTISPDSLRTLREARRITSVADSVRGAWGSAVRALDPRSQIDSARVLVQRLGGGDRGVLGLAGAARAAASARTAIGGLSSTLDRIRGLGQTADSGTAALRSAVAALGDARRADYGYARRLVALPSLNAPSISPAMFGEIAIERLKPVLYWLAIADRYMPPGLNPRLRPGPDRARSSGTTVHFPRKTSYPSFLIRFAEADLTIGGSDVAAGRYVARVAGLTTAPAIYGRPTQFLAGRAGGSGPSTIRIAGELQHAVRPVRDSAEAFLAGVGLPTISLPGMGARLDMGRGSTELVVRRVGDSLVARWRVRSDDVTWERTGQGRTSPTGGAGSVVQSGVEDLLWRTLSGLRAVEVEAEIGGSISNPKLAVRSNVGQALAESLRRQVGAEVAQAERQLRAHVDGLVEERTRDARDQLQVLETEVRDRIAGYRAQLEAARAELEARLRQLVGARD